MRATLLCCFLGFLGLVFGQYQDDILLKTSSPDSVNYYLDSYDGYCQACLGFNLANADRGRFRFLYEEVRELDQNGTECCVPGDAGCTSGIGCNWHAYGRFAKFYNQTFTNTTARVNGTIKSSGNVGSCPPGTITAGSICATFDWYYELVNETTNMTVGNYTFTLYKNMILIRFTISTWPFAAGSTGIRLKVSFGTEGTTCEHWYLNPGSDEVDNDNIDLFASNYSSCRAKDFYDHSGEVFFTPVAIRDETTVVWVPVKGPIDYSEPDSREFTIDFPVFSKSMTYYMGATVPKASGLGKAGRLTASMAATLGLAVLPFLL
mmetsp:Transcript_20623/g.28957  ORF Transcript_20623/g.28957 Transcript_20623/m.28957 type:complete len:320 (-) Transcript_20623:191-1150(-)